MMDESDWQAKIKREDELGKKVIGMIVGQTIVAVEGKPGWDGQWLSSLEGPTFILGNGLRIRSLGEPMAVETESYAPVEVSD